MRLITACARGLCLVLLLPSLGVVAVVGPALASDPSCPTTREDPALFGDWNGDGVDTPGVHRGNTFLFSDVAATVSWEYAISWGQTTDTPIVGDWDGDGVASPGLKRGNTYFLANDGGDGQPNPAGVDFDSEPTYATFVWGNASDIPVVADWDNNGTDTVGRKNGNVYTLAASNSSSPGIFKTVAWGQANDDAVAGDWDNNGTETLGLKRGKTWYLASANVQSPGNPGEYATFTYGGVCDTALARNPASGQATQVSVRQDRRFDDVTGDPISRRWWIRGVGTYFTYPRPVVLVSDDQIAQAQARVSAGSGTYYDAYQLTKRYASHGPDLGSSPVTSQPDPYTAVPYQEQDYNLYRVAARDQSSMARDAALVYRIEGLGGYADKAQEILLAWATDPGRVSNVACEDAGGASCLSAGMVISRAVINFAGVYALLFDRFTPAERAQIEKWLLAMAGRVEVSRLMWVDYANGGSERYNNHVTAMTMGALAIALALDDAEPTYELLRGGTFPSSVRRQMGGVLLPACGTAGQPACSTVLAHNDPTLTLARPKPLKGEIYDRYRSLPNSSQGRRGLAYAVHQLRLLTLLSEMANNSYHDRTLFARANANGVTLRDSFQTYAPFWSYDPHACPGLGASTQGPAALFAQGTGYYADDDPATLALCWKGVSSVWEFAFREYDDAAAREVLCHNRGRLTYEDEAIGWNGALLFGKDITPAC